MDYFFVFIVGTVFGSFINVCAYRIPQNISIIKPGSFCPHCKKPIPFYLNIPLLGFLLLKGKCQNCGQPIPKSYFLVELLTGLATLLLFSKFGLQPSFFFYSILLYFLMLISLIDIFARLILNKLLLYLLIAGVIFNLFFLIISWENALLGGAIGGGALYVFSVLGKVLFHKESMGMGDIKMAATLGLFLGWKIVLLALFLGFCYALVAVLIFAARPGKDIQKYVPMAPFFSLGVFTFLCWGPNIINWYWNLVLPVKG